MNNVASVVRGLNRNQKLRVINPDIGEVTVIIPQPRKTANVAPGVKQFVFTHTSGRMIGLNWSVPDDYDNWKECTLVEDIDGWQHALLLRKNDKTHLLTRQEPGEPDDWEDRGKVKEITEIRAETPS
jgi:hypothetical protein